MKKVMKLFVACLGFMTLTPLTAGATTSHLTQTIQPIQCTYTVLTTGTVTLTPTQCSNQLVPTLSTFTTTLQPRLTGTFASAQASSLRVWVGQNWFTLGVSSALTAVGDNWVLDLANTSLVLAPSTTYTVIVEEMTTSGYLLSSVYTDVLVTQAASVPTAANTGTSSPIVTQSQSVLQTSSIPIDLTAPLNQSGVSRYYDMSSFNTLETNTDEAKPVSSYVISNWPIILVVMLTSFAVLAKIGFMKTLYIVGKAISGVLAKLRRP